MAGRDLRKWISQLESESDFKRISAEVDWDEEISQIIRKVYAENGPALLFSNIKGHHDTRGKKLFVNGLGTHSRMNLMLNLSKNTPVTETIKTIRNRIKKPVEPERVKTGPVKENIVRGSEVNLFEFPVPKWHAHDTKRYINTFYSAVTRDPDSGRLNCGTYRGGIIAKNKISCLLAPMKDWGIVFCKYQQMGKDMPVAFVYGYDPALLCVSGVPFIGPEYDLAGGLRQSPIELVKCETSDIEVPAYAEIVVEGTISTDPNTFETEGPFGEACGYYGEARKRPVVKVSCITHRNDPIFRGSYVGTKGVIPDELKVMVGNTMSACVWSILDSQEIPGILDVQTGHITGIKIHKTYHGQARQIAAALWGSKFAGQGHNIVMVVEEDFDVHNPASLHKAFRDKVDFEKGLVVYPLAIGSPADPGIPYELRDELAYGAGVQKKLLIDATTDWEIHPFRPEWGNCRFPPTCFEPSPGIEELVEKRWKEYGL
jgi:UbiD family decarboxylase